MRRYLVSGGLAAALVLALVAAAVAARPSVQAARTIQVIERATTDTVIDTDMSGGDSTGDLLTFHNRIYDATNTTQVGRDQGECIRISPAQGSWECRWITWIFGEGAITVEGPFFDTHDSSLAITGGTGGFHNVRGVLRLHALSATEFEFVFRVEP